MSVLGSLESSSIITRSNNPRRSPIQRIRETVRWLSLDDGWAYATEMGACVRCSIRTCAAFTHVREGLRAGGNDQLQFGNCP